LVPELRRLLDSPHYYERAEAVRAIGAIGPAAAELLPDLRRRLESSPPLDSIRRDLQNAIKKISATDVMCWTSLS
jgi:HEAT repeat protein